MLKYLKIQREDIQMRSVYIRYENKERGEDLDGTYWGIGKLINIKDTVMIKDESVYINVSTAEELENYDLEENAFESVLEIEIDNIKDLQEQVYLWMSNIIMTLDIIDLKMNNIDKTFTVQYRLSKIEEMTYED